MKLVVTDPDLSDAQSMNLQEGPDLPQGSGVSPFTVHVINTQDNNPMADVAVWLATAEGGENAIAGGRTNATGDIILYPDVDQDSTIYAFCMKAGYSFANPFALTVGSTPGVCRGTELAALNGTIVTVDMIRKRINIPEATAMRTEDIAEAISDAAFDVEDDTIRELTSEMKVRATVVYAVYYAIRTYSTRGRHVPSGHMGDTGHWVADETPQGIFDFRPALKEAKDAYDAMKTRLRPKISGSWGVYG